LLNIKQKYSKIHSQKHCEMVAIAVYMHTSECQMISGKIYILKTIIHIVHKPEFD